MVKHIYNQPTATVTRKWDTCEIGHMCMSPAEVLACKDSQKIQSTINKALEEIDLFKASVGNRQLLFFSANSYDPFTEGTTISNQIVQLARIRLGQIATQTVALPEKAPVSHCCVLL